MNGAITSDSVNDQDLADHPSQAELYDFFASRGTKLDRKRRQTIAAHVLFCGECAREGTFIEETEEYLDAELAVSLSEKDRAEIETSLATIRSLAVSHDSAPQGSVKGILILVEDFFRFRWSTLSGRLIGIASIAVCFAGFVILCVVAVSRFTRYAEQLPNSINLPSPEVATARPQPSSAPPKPSPSGEWSVKRKLRDRSGNEDEENQLLARLNTDLNLSRSKESLDRGGGTKVKSHPTIFARSRGLTQIRIRLPEGSVAGPYSVTIEDAYFNPLRPPANGESPDGRNLAVSLDLVGLRGRVHYLGIAREVGPPVHYQISVKFAKHDSAGTKPPAP